MKVILRKKRIIFRVIFLVFTLLMFSGCTETIDNKDKVIISFDYSNGEVVTKEINKGENIVMPVEPEKENYEFLGWFIGNEEFDFSKGIDSDIVLTARFRIDEDLANEYKIIYIVNGDVYREATCKEDRYASKNIPQNKYGYTFKGWSLEENSSELFDFKTQVKSDLTFYAYYEPNKIKVSFSVNGVISEVECDYDSKLTKPVDPSIEKKDFVGWYLNDELYNFDSAVTNSFTLVAKFKRSKDEVIRVEYDFSYDCYQTKEDLKLDFYKDFYDFLLMKEYDFSKYNIESFEDFYQFVNTFKYGNVNEMAEIGYAFKDYYMDANYQGKLEDQSEDRFVGYITKKGKYIDYFHHMETFFEWWRTDEGCSQGDPFKNDFYADPWASMVDTAKFFYFDGDTLQTLNNGIYRWFTSERVKFALDNIPGVGYVRLKYEEIEDEYLELPLNVTREGYRFLGWFDEKNGGNKLERIDVSMKLYAHWEKIGD